MAIKKFKESDKDDTMKKIYVREVKFLKMCEHENIVHLKDSFRRKEKLHLVFEYIDKTLLEVLEANGGKGLGVDARDRAGADPELPVPADEGAGLPALPQHHPPRREARKHAREQVIMIYAGKACSSSATSASRACCPPTARPSPTMSPRAGTARPSCCSPTATANPQTSGPSAASWAS